MSDPFFHGSPAELPDTVFDRDPAPVADTGLPNYWINTASLALVIRDTLFRYKGRGPEIAGILTYHSGSGLAGIFGMKWRFSYESEIHTAGTVLSLVRGSGQVMRYVLPAAPVQPGQPVDLAPLDFQQDRLLDYGSFWLFIEKSSSLMYRYDKMPGSPRALLTSIADQNTNTVRIGYTRTGIPASVTDAAGRTLEIQTDSAGRCTALVLPDSRRAAFSYDPLGRLSRSLDFEGIPSEYQYNGSHGIISLVVAKDRKTTLFSYGGKSGSEVASVTDAAGHVRRYEVLSENPRKVRITDPENNQTLYLSSGGLTSAIENDGQAVRFTFNERRQRTSVTSRLGHVTLFEYDFRGNITRITDPAGSQLLFAWTPHDRISSVTDPLGNSTRIGYDERQNPVTRVTPSGNTHRFAYDQLGQLVRHTLPGGGAHAFTYDRFGNPESETDPTGGKITFDYDPAGLRLLGMTDANRNRTSFAYDNNGRRTRIVRPDGSTKEYTFGCCAGLATRNENGAISRFTRDPRLLVTEYIDGSGNTIRFSYDRLRRLTSVTDPRGSVTTILCSDREGTVTITGPDGSVIRQSYDTDGRLVAISDPEGALFQYSYDPCGRLAGYSDAAGGSERYDRDPAGRIHRIVNGRGMEIRYGYTADGLVKEKAWNGSPAAAYSYDPDDNLVAVEDGTGRTAFRRDPAGRVAALVYDGKHEVSCSYDPAGSPRELRYPDGLEVLYTYDSQGCISRIVFGSDSISFRYDATGNPEGQSCSNGVESLWRYDADNRVSEIRHSRGEKTIVHLQYKRDANRNIIEERALQPLQSPGRSGPEAVTAHRIGRILTCGSREYQYDADGNLVMAGPGFSGAGYDPENRLVHVSCHDRVVESRYNGLGQRCVRTTGPATARMYYDALDRLLFETDLAGNVTASYIYAGPLLVARRRAGETGFYHFDKTGNTLCITGPDGSISAAYAYDTYGMVTAREPESDPNPFTFVGQHGVVDDGGGLYLMRRRHYDAVTGRFLQRDPSGIRGGLNLYAYAGNNPVTLIDPNGTDFGITLGVITVGALIFGVGAWAQKTFNAKNNTIIRGLEAANDRIANPNQVSTQDVINKIGPDPGKQVLTEMGSAGAHVADKLLGAHPVVGPGYTAIKAGVLIGTGQPGEGVKEAITVMPNIGETAGAIKEVGEAIGECRAP